MDGRTDNSKPDLNWRWELYRICMRLSTSAQITKLSFGTLKIATLRTEGDSQLYDSDDYFYPKYKILKMILIW